MANVNAWWSTLSPTAKRNLAVGSIGTVLLATIVGLALVSPEIAKPSSKQATIQHILTDSDPRSLGIDGISSQLLYMDMAEEIYPVIEVDATRQVNFIVQKGTALKLKIPT